MFGQIASNRNMVIPLIVVALAAIAIAGFRVMKSAENSRAAQTQGAQAAQTTEGSETAQVSGPGLTSESAPGQIGFVQVADRDPFSHRSFFTAALDDLAGPAAPPSADLSSVLSGTPFGQLAPFAPMLGPDSSTGFDGSRSETDTGGPAGSPEGPQARDPGLTLASIIAGEEPLAIITDSLGHKFFVSEGQAVSEEYLVESIHSRSVVLRVGDERISLWLDASSRGKD